MIDLEDLDRKAMVGAVIRVALMFLFAGLLSLGVMYGLDKAGAMPVSDKFNLGTSISQGGGITW